ncbi:leucyl/phenylalanyl-tRNA--protein transferase [Acetobacteraceae bacterium KSS8]|uniref:Leucyl/phenylalanyl-tRNA--protein transferase n=2 Tax=Endosaccharibacter trunci TaxID=2812733 RepID=A0ABT1W240_9PROT|nr:leucyl/phenylalanyl-tRNA--protein transferase [Acetobacteraceae bacterium KSS8]
MLVQAYRAGIFPMAETRDAGTLSWYDPDPRGILPLDAFHLPRRLFRTVRSGVFRVTADTAFDRVIAECAASAAGREESWINGTIAALFGSLHRRPVDGGRAHSVECWIESPAAPPVLAGGLYGLQIGSAFFGESMFSRARDASKVALVHLVARLRLSGVTLLDTQFLTEHLSQFGAVEVSRADYRTALAAALARHAQFQADPSPPVLADSIAQLAARSRP